MKIRWPVVCLSLLLFALILGSPQAAFARNDQERNDAPAFEGNPTGGFYGMDGPGGGGSGAPVIPPDEDLIRKVALPKERATTQLPIFGIGPSIWLPWLDVSRVIDYTARLSKDPNSGIRR